MLTTDWNVGNTWKYYSQMDCCDASCIKDLKTSSSYGFNFQHCHLYKARLSIHAFSYWIVAFYKMVMKATDS
jgi:hypothetical protein